METTAITLDQYKSRRSDLCYRMQLTHQEERDSVGILEQRKSEIRKEYAERMRMSNIKIQEELTIRIREVNTSIAQIRSSYAQKRTDIDTELRLLDITFRNQTFPNPQSPTTHP